ncbi:MAG: hypothetical protein H7259_02955, partial [Cytophagales bacterium]|nr:hypothetical protein [Cytophaga sp.]
MKHLLIILLLIYSIKLSAQTPLEESSLIEQLTSNEDLIQVNSEAAENLSMYLKNPLDINTADEAALLNMGFLKDAQVRDILEYQHQYGPLINMHELQILPSMNLQTFQWMQTCFIIRTKTDEWALLKHIAGHDQSMLLLRYVPPINNRADNWEGNSDKAAIRFQTSVPNKMRFAFSMEKDAGEPMRWKAGESYYGFDNWNGYVQYYPTKKWKQIIIGTYRQQFGQGVLMGGGFFAGKGSETITTLRKAGRVM